MLSAPAPPQTSASAASTLAAGDWIAGLEKGLQVLEAFDESHPRMTIAAVSQRCALSRTAARRYLLTLKHLGFVASDGKQFWLTPRVLRLGHAYLESARLPRIVQPYLQRITAGTHEIAFLSVMDGDEVVFIARNGSTRSMSTGIVLGSRVQPQVTAAGLMLLALRDAAWVDAWLAGQPLRAYTSHSVLDAAALRATLGAARAQGWAVCEQQLELGYRGVAVPLIDFHGQAAGALSVTLPMGQETTQAAVARVLPVLQDVVRSMRHLL